MVLLVNKPLNVPKRDLRKRLWTGRKEELEIQRIVRERMGGVVTALEIWLSDSFGEINGAISSSFVDSAFMVRMGVPEPIEMQGICHGLWTRSIGHRRGHWSTGGARKSMIIGR